MIETIICVAVLTAIPLSTAIMLLYPIFTKDTYNPSSRGPLCDICGEPLAEHGMYECEAYC